LKAVIWDCDGVLVDSEPHSVASWVTVLGRFGSEVTASDVEGCLGLGYPDTYERLASVPSGDPIPGPDDLWPLLMEAIGVSFGPFLPPFPDALETIEALGDRGIPQAVATSSKRSRVELALERSRLTDWFVGIVAGDQVEQTKPAPDVYLAAAGLLGTGPPECVAVEDSANGCRAAIAAGMPVIGVVRIEQEREPMTKTGAVVVNSIEVKEVLALLGIS
jgi:beta-phosphoglucomutase-like phosphatase (HAD superfamily)